jgi:uncharacterized protein YigE (DUF2233 family)
MKKWFLVFLTIIFLIFAGFFYWKSSVPKLPPNKVLSANEAPTVTPRVWKQSIVMNVDGVPIRVSWAQVQPKEVELYSNLKERKLSEEIKVNKSCQILVSGGFYSTENMHLGLFISNFETISKSIQSATHNGFLWIDSDGTIVISSDPPSITPRLGLQSGPLLIQKSLPIPLIIKNDEPSRRIVAGITSDNQLIFLVFYRDSSQFEGPMLETLPEVVKLFEKQTGISILDAINLDGGSASIFISNYDRLNELAHVGSYFCIK